MTILAINCSCVHFYVRIKLNKSTFLFVHGKNPLGRTLIKLLKIKSNANLYSSYASYFIEIITPIVTYLYLR